MSRTTKIILGVLAGVLVLCLCVGIGGFLLMGRLVSNSVSTSSGDAAATARQITDYTLPAGWSEETAVHLMGVSMVIIRAGSSRSVATLMQLPASSQGSEALFEQQMRQAAGANLPGQMAEVGQRQATLRGQPVTLTISEGKDASGLTYRQLMGSFQGKGGTALLMIAGPVSEWNQSSIDSFLASMR